MHRCVDWLGGIPWFRGCFLLVAFGTRSGRTSLVPRNENRQTQPIKTEREQLKDREGWEILGA